MVRQLCRNTSVGMSIFKRQLHSKKTPLPNRATDPFGISTDTSLTHTANARSSTVSTVDGNEKACRLQQYSNARSLMLLNPSDRTTSTNNEHLSNVFTSIVSTVKGMDARASTECRYSVSALFSSDCNPSSKTTSTGDNLRRRAASTGLSTLVSVQPSSKAPCPMLFKSRGNSHSTKLLHCEKAPSPTVCTVDGSLIDGSDSHCRNDSLPTIFNPSNSKTEAITSHPRNAPSSITSTVEGISMLDNSQSVNAKLPIRFNP
mmetsp:Transcript_4044/g.9380  ORF Transcript_4044/g.9380 Transcript_4044/m.9380 type:complete len:260 (-) Transcript_4044:335-1114(-)